MALSLMSVNAAERAATHATSELAERAALETRIRELLDARQETLASLYRNNESYLNELIKLRVLEKDRLAKAGELERFISERILWVRSADPLEDFGQGLPVGHVAGMIGRFHARGSELLKAAVDLHVVLHAIPVLFR
jgi:hypothetical protein